MRIAKKPMAFALIGIVAYLLFLVAELPASFVSKTFFAGAPAGRQLDLGSLNGTVWHGEALGAHYAHLELGRLSWELGVLPLLLGHLDVDFRFNSETNRGHGNLTLGMGGAVDVDELYVSLPAEKIIPFIPLLHRFRVNAGGELQANLQEAEIEQGRTLKGKGRVVWRDASLLVPYNMDLGNFVATLEPDGTGTNIKVQDQDGPVMLRATVSVKGNGQFEMQARLKARDPSQQHITSALQVLGRPDSDGWFSTAQKGVIPNWRIK